MSNDNDLESASGLVVDSKNSPPSYEKPQQMSLSSADQEPKQISDVTKQPNSSQSSLSASMPGKASFCAYFFDENCPTAMIPLKFRTPVWRKSSGRSFVLWREQTKFERIMELWKFLVE